MSADTNLGPSAREGRSFHVRTCLGRGGFGEVYRATMVSTGGVRSEVAIKVLHADVEPDSQAVRRLRDEGRLLGAVRHPAVLKVHDLVLLHERVALVTEYVEGADLDKCLAGHDPMSLRGLIEVVGRVAEALDSAFRSPSPNGGPLNLIHRDIKPANIRIGRHGQVKLLDFGIARAANVEREARTETHAMLGSYLYMAPERFLDGKGSGPAVDVFSLGCTLYEGIAHKRLFGEMSLKELYLLVLDESKYDTFLNDALDRLPADVPSEVLQLLSQMLELRPERRPTEPEVARGCYDLADLLPGKSLDRWARERAWPRPRRVKGMLDGKVIVETATGSDVFDDVVLPDPDEQLADEPTAVAPASMRSPSIETSTPWPTVSKTLSSTFERPRPLLFGVGLFTMGTASALTVVVVGLLGITAWLLWPSPVAGIEPAPPVAPVLTAPAPGPAPVEPKPAPTPPPASIAAPAPAPVAPAPVRPAPQPKPDPVPIRVAPVPVPVPAPAPAPAPVAAAEGTVRVQTSVLVEFHLRGGGVHRAGRMPAGTYDVYARWPGRSMAATGTQFQLTAGQELNVICTKFSETCEVRL